jgi:hypothetical protein
MELVKVMFPVVDASSSRSRGGWRRLGGGQVPVVEGVGALTAWRLAKKRAERRMLADFILAAWFVQRVESDSIGGCVGLDKRAVGAGGGMDCRDCAALILC